MRRRYYQNRQDSNRLAVVLILLVVFICGPAVGGSGYALIKQLSSDDIRFYMGAVYFLVAFVTITGGFSLVLVSYSRLRRAEESEDDKREIELLKVALGRGQNWVMQQPLALPEEQPVMDYQETVDFE